MNQSGWSNIPHCITKAINTLLEKTNENSSEIEEVKNSLSDLIIKFQVKTSRLDSTLQELSLSFKSSIPPLTEEINTLKVKTDTIISNFESKMKPVNETLNDLKQKLAGLASELKRESRELVNKLEKLKHEQEVQLEEYIDRVLDKLHTNETNTQKKLQTLGYKLDSDYENLTNVLDKVKNDLAVNGLKINEHTELISIQFSTCKGLEEKIEEVKGNFKEFEKEQEEFAALIQTLTRPVPQVNTVEKKKTVPKDMIINPIFDRINEVEEKFEENFCKLSEMIASFDVAQNNSIKANRNSIQDWTVEKVNNAVNDLYLKLKEKLEWLPDSSYSMKNMGVTEARLFLIESRLRSEEKQRILNDQQILDLLSSNKPKNEPKIFESRRRGSLSPSQGKNSFLSIDKKPNFTHNPKKNRPSSSYQQREISSQDKLKDILLIKV